MEVSDKKVEVRLAMTADGTTITLIVSAETPLTTIEFKDIMLKYLDLPVFQKPKEETVPDAPATT